MSQHNEQRDNLEVVAQYLADGDSHTTPLWRVAQAVYGEPWAITPEVYLTICRVVRQRLEGDAPVYGALELAAESRQAYAVRAAAHAETSATTSVAVLPLYGVLSHRMNLMTAMSGGTSSENFGRAFQSAVRDESIGSIIIDVDSPGGSVFGMQELWDTIMQARGTKPVVAVANDMMASAAYYIGSAADEIVVTPGGEVGSIGVVVAHEDISGAQEREGVKTTLVSAGEKKVLGNPFEPLSEEALEMLEGKVQAYYGMFVEAVRKGRGVSAKDVRSGFGKGGLEMGQAALDAGLADRIGTLDQTISRLSGGGKRRPRAAAKAEVQGPSSRRRTLLH
jgi:signal peptide peptidase SppA